jgi:hypothetical protein
MTIKRYWQITNGSEWDIPTEAIHKFHRHGNDEENSLDHEQ